MKWKNLETVHNTIEQDIVAQLEKDWSTINKYRGCRFDGAQRIIIMSWTETEKWKDFRKLRNACITVENQKNTFHFAPIENWVHTHFPTPKKQKATWFVGGITAGVFATVGFLKLYSYCFPKK